VLGFHASSQGKVALAWGDEAVTKRVFSAKLDMKTPSTITSPQALQAEIARVRDRGWAVSPNEAMTGVNALAAPLFDGSATLVGAVAIVDSVQFVEAAPSAEQIRQVVGAAERISRALGYAGRAITIK
jgi:DNA-binding IclR family transcriptional regulator